MTQNVGLNADHFSVMIVIIRWVVFCDKPDLINRLCPGQKKWIKNSEPQEYQEAFKKELSKHIHPHQIHYVAAAGPRNRFYYRNYLSPILSLKCRRFIR